MSEKEELTLSTPVVTISDRNTEVGHLYAVSRRDYFIAAAITAALRHLSPEKIASTSIAIADEILAIVDKPKE